MPKRQINRNGILDMFKIVPPGHRYNVKSGIQWALLDGGGICGLEDAYEEIVEVRDYVINKLKGQWLKDK